MIKIGNEYIRIVCYFMMILIAATFSLQIHAQGKAGKEVAEILEKVHDYYQKGEINEALDILNEGLTVFTDSDYDRFFILNYKANILTDLGNIEEAVNSSVEKAIILKSPKQALNVADLYIELKEMDKALEWINISADWGLQDYEKLSGTRYQVLHSDVRFIDVVNRIRRNTGVGKMARPFRDISIDGQEVAIESLKGQVVLLEFWATWCGPCVNQIPKLKSLYQEYHEKGFEIIGFSEDKNESELRKFLIQNKITWENVFCPEGRNHATIKLYEVSSIPASFLIDRRGIVRYVNLNGTNLEEAVNELLEL